LLAYLRVVDPGIKYPEASIGRVITAPKVRGTGLGRLLIREGVRRCHLAWPGRGIRISAQSHLQPFYTEVGFVGQGEDYLEDGIPHREMLLAWPEGQS
jgi:ElaA protein